MFAVPDHADCTDPFVSHYHALLTPDFRTLCHPADLWRCACSHPIQNRTSGFTASKCILFPHRGYVVFFCGTALIIPWSSKSLSWISAYRRLQSVLFRTVPAFEKVRPSLIVFFVDYPDVLVVSDLPMHYSPLPPGRHHKGSAIGHQKYHGTRYQ